MDMHEEAFDTFSLSDLHIYSDPSCSSKEEQDLGNSFSSFRFKIAGSLPSEEIVFLGNLISLPKTDLKPRHMPQKPSRMKASKVVRPRRRTGRGVLIGLGGAPARMEVFELRSSMQARASPPRVVPVNGGGVEEVTRGRKSGNWLGRLFGACIPIV
ncbi:hypothetical protein L1987_24959 [Smallanthus sonchifolius]|uniref:Uncharacterized protein n=1 Tax=Smallanthus sonchifolius TaxID=185202 RepID=A0ACB9ILX7_9ASTR|nr:hypothetical protein L1987_24959 [Smallanthus sonchifolius]